MLAERRPYRLPLEYPAHFHGIGIQLPGDGCIRPVGVDLAHVYNLSVQVLVFFRRANFQMVPFRTVAHEVKA